MITMQASVRLFGWLTLCFAWTSGVAGAGECPDLTVAAVPPVVRAEGLADLQGDVIGLCSTTTPGATAYSLATDVTLTLNVNVTNNRDYGLGVNLTDAVLIINEQTANPPTISFVPGSPMLGTLTNQNQLQWSGVTLPIPGEGDSLSIRIASLRGNVNALGFPPVSTPRVKANLAFSNSSITTTNNPIDIGFSVQGLLPTLLPGGVATSFNVRLSEAFAAAFKPLGAPTLQPALVQAEDGYPTPGSGVNGGGAGQGTRVVIRFLNVPNNVRIVAPTTAQNLNNNFNLVINRVVGSDANGAGGFTIAGPPFGLVPQVGTSGVLFYEIISGNPFAIENLVIPIQVCHQGGPIPCNNPLDAKHLQQMQVAVSFAPLSTVVVSDGPAPEPRFAETGTAMSIP
jgi:hypothetical protein